MPRPVVFLTDFGWEDAFVGICHGVLARGSPSSNVIDLAHTVPPQDVRRGALLLARSVPYMPADAVYLAVVDPGVGTDRRSVALETVSGAVMVGPDNGLLSMAWAAAGGVARAVRITSEQVILRPTAPTFHGRDVFAPAAGHMAAGGRVEDLGPDVEPSTLVMLSAPAPDVRPGVVRCEVMGIDRFGNVELSSGEAALADAGIDESSAIEVEGPVGGTALVRARTFGEVAPGDAALIVDSSGWLAVVVNGGNAAEGFGLSIGDAVILRGAADR